MSSHTSLAPFPNEVYLEILNKFDAWKDKRALVNLALVNQFWRHQTQRTLFYHVGRWEYDGGETSWPASDKIHMRFWESMLVDPARLGSYVIEYTHRVRYATLYDSDPYFIKRAMKPATKCFPYFVNLKSLTFQPQNNRRAPFLRLLKGCTFQLENLAWMSSEESTKDLRAFLRTQRGLRHLDIEIRGPGDPENHDYLPKDSCPELMSMSCNVDGLPSLAYRPSITVMEVYRLSHEHITVTEDDAVVLRRLTHLKVMQHLLGLGFPGVSLPNVLLLNVDPILPGKPTYLSHFPGLRVLVYNDLYSMLEEEFEDSYVPFIFEECPRLERIIAHDIIKTYFTTFTVTRGEDGVILEVHSEVTDRDFDHTAPWWKAYEMEL